MTHNQHLKDLHFFLAKDFQKDYSAKLARE